MQHTTPVQTTTCFHCGENCNGTVITAWDKPFCCEGCKMVYEILNQAGLCDYYNLSENPGISRKIRVRADKFAFLDEEKIAASLISFRDADQTHITFYIPQIHCSSCLWLLENLHRINPGIVSGRVQFERKEVTVVFNHNRVSLRKVAELLNSVGYEPHISLQQMQQKPRSVNRSLLYKLGVAGFCFSNIMLLSFPEYFGITDSEAILQPVFRWLNLALGLPVFLYAATEFYTSAWKSLQHKFLNIDAPIVLAIFITFGRSVYEIFSGTGAGYIDSMSGIVFFMLLGRVLQNKTYSHLNFERDYTAYFPVAVAVISNKQEHFVSLPDIKLNDTLLIHNNEIIPADGIVTRGNAIIDYSFVTGESTPVEKQMGEIVYAGGRQTGGNIEVLVIKEVSQGYLTGLWNRAGLKTARDDSEKSFVHALSRWFTWIVFAVAFSAALFWTLKDQSVVWNAVTAVLIVACPCALLLSNTFTNGNILRILGRNRFYLRNAATIEALAKADFIVFDKTGTLTDTASLTARYEGIALHNEQRCMIASVVAQSTHPLSRAILAYTGEQHAVMPVHFFKSWEGSGIEGTVQGNRLHIGSYAFIRHIVLVDDTDTTGVYVAINNNLLGKFRIEQQYRTGLEQLISYFKKRYSLAVLSGDNAKEKGYLQQLFGQQAALHFNQSPEEKLQMIKSLQHKGNSIVMIGDGLNDAGALLQADAGIAVTDNCNNFTPACDGILEAGALPQLDRFIRLSKANGRIVIAAFFVSIIYNIIGLCFAVSGMLSPLVAAILMPASSLSILLVTYGSSNLFAAWLGLKGGKAGA